MCAEPQMLQFQPFLPPGMRVMQTRQKPPIHPFGSCGHRLLHDWSWFAAYSAMAR
jgi:hypothetical protein